jgi:transcriptional regulator with XRE-family HTH domain
LLLFVLKQPALYLRDMTDDLGKRVKTARLHAKLTQEQLATRVRKLAGSDKFKQQSLQRIESGQVKASSYTTLIASATKVDSMWLSTGKGEMLPSANSETSGNYNSDLYSPDHQYEVALMRTVLKNVNEIMREEKLTLNEDEMSRVIVAAYFAGLRNKVKPDTFDSNTILTAIQAIM